MVMFPSGRYNFINNETIVRPPGAGDSPPRRAHRPIPQGGQQPGAHHPARTEAAQPRDRKRHPGTPPATQAVEARINFMKTKEEKTVKKVLNVKRKLTSLESVKMKAKELKELSMEVTPPPLRKRRKPRRTRRGRRSSTNSSRTTSSTTRRS